MRVPDTTEACNSGCCAAEEIRSYFQVKKSS